MKKAFRHIGGLHKHNTADRRWIDVTKLPLTNPQIPFAAAKIAADIPRDVIGRTLLERKKAIPPCAFFQPIPNFVSGVLGEPLGGKDGILMKPAEARSEL